MSYTFEEGKQAIIKSVTDKIKQSFSGNSGPWCAEFANQFYNTVALEDLQEWTIDDLYGAVINLWSFIHERTPEETKIRIYNPDFEKHGWQTTHTVVEIISEDMPFLVDSLRMVVNRMGLSAHLIIHMGGVKLKRDDKHSIVGIYARDSSSKDSKIFVEAPLFMEIDRQTDPLILETLQKNLEHALHDNRLVYQDWDAMRTKVREATAQLDALVNVLDAEEIHETKAFLTWIEDHHFTFLGLRDYELVSKGNETVLQSIPGTGLGLLRENITQSSVKNIADMTPEARALILSPRVLLMSKTNTLATVHRDTYMDYIGIKWFDAKGKVLGERRILGLYTAAAYHTNPRHIPFLRHKVALIMANSKFSPRSHSGKILLNILETLPRDDLIQGSETELLDIAMGVFYMQDRRRIRMFTRADVYRHFISCLVYVPRDRFNTELRQAMQAILATSFQAEEITFATQFSESLLARIHFNIKVNPKDWPQYDLKKIEKQLIEVGRTWNDDLQMYLLEVFGEEQANYLFNRYKNAFPLAYCDTFSPKVAVYDIKHIQTLTEENPLGMNFYRPMDEEANSFRLKVYQHKDTLPLSDVLPILENLGLRAISERPYMIKYSDGNVTWVNDVAMRYKNAGELDIDTLKEAFQTAFAKVLFGEAENDGFNQLILAAGLNWREVKILRTYAKYFKQIGFTFSQDYMEKALNNNVGITKKLVALFDLKFNPVGTQDREVLCATLTAAIITDLDTVVNLDEDKIIRQYVHAINASLRTNFYQPDEQNKPKTYLSIKLNTRAIPGVPKPHPMYEIFIYSPRFDGVHLRCGKVARGGIRWSDRREDFRTEILGLMKAQQVKNSVIVPCGAKGGFVPKRLPVNGTREEILAEGVSCYQLFIKGLLDITDNYSQGLVVKPAAVVCYDEDDPYLVVAADKGTATFSDIANAISIEYGFWLGDAFASGGSVGYDHKKMGITAKGAWESVKRHFYELDIDIMKHDFTVVGIGDMAGDVFGNGMMLSPHIKLLGAFNHVHIFIDPNPDAKKSFDERVRLFNLPRSSWTDYNLQLISKGGGVFNRSAKSIPVSKEMQKLFGIKQTSIEPNELIKTLLKARVDLLWSAGIGTYVKSSNETNSNVGDRTNDATRVSAKYLKCKVIGEGGNLGLTQLARVEYALHGGKIYTDFIDNSGGVNCSDKEVNIKILLNTIVTAGDLTAKQREILLSAMTDEVSGLVLRDNFLQPRAISLSASQSLRSFELQKRYINELERLGKLDRNLEFLPDNNQLVERRLKDQGLLSPEIAVLLCYSKTLLKEQILASSLPEEPYMNQFLMASFPKPLQERYSKPMQDHPLKREIIATKLSNIVINEMGFTFVYRLQDETSASAASIVKAYMITRDVLNLEAIWKQMEDLGTGIIAQKQIEMMMHYIRLSRRVTRWFLRSEKRSLDLIQAVSLYSKGVSELKQCTPGIFSNAHKDQYQAQYQEFIEEGVPAALAHELTLTRALFAAADIIDIASIKSVSVEKVAETYYAIGGFLELDWLRTQVIAHPADNRWESLSRESIRDDLDYQQRQLTIALVGFTDKSSSAEDLLASWSATYEGLVARWRIILAELRATSSLNYIMFFVAIRELVDLTQNALHTHGVVI